MKVLNFWQHRIVGPLVQILKTGVTPRKMALSIAVGITIGVLPSLGLPTILCTIAALAFRLNLPTIQIVNYLVYPLWFACLIPFYRAGEFLFSSKPLAPSPTKLIAMFEANTWSITMALWTATWHACVVWALVALPAIGLLYRLLLPILARFPIQEDDCITKPERSPIWF